MKKDFDFNRIGKRMPYTTPPQFLEEIEKNVWKSIEATPIAPTPFHRNIHLGLSLGIAAAAASIALFLLVRPAQPVISPVELPQVEQAFAQLNIEDQTYLLDTFQDDIYINEE